MVKLGSLVKDKVSGLNGIVIGRSVWLYGCTRLCVQPREHKDGKPAESFHIDEPQAEVIREDVIKGVAPEGAPPAPKPRPGGPRPDAQRAADARR